MGSDGDGNPSTWTSTNNLYFGESGHGELRVQDGAVVSNTAARIASNSGSTAEVIVSGSGPTWNNVGLFTVGRAGPGLLTIQYGASVLSG